MNINVNKLIRTKLVQLLNVDSFNSKDLMDTLNFTSLSILNTDKKLSEDDKTKYWIEFVDIMKLVTSIKDIYDINDIYSKLCDLNSSINDNSYQNLWDAIKLMIIPIAEKSLKSMNDKAKSREVLDLIRSLRATKNNEEILAKLSKKDTDISRYFNELVSKYGLDYAMLAMASNGFKSVLASYLSEGKSELFVKLSSLNNIIREFITKNMSEFNQDVLNSLISTQNDGIIINSSSIPLSSTSQKG